MTIIDLNEYRRKRAAERDLYTGNGVGALPVRDPLAPQLGLPFGPDESYIEPELSPGFRDVFLDTFASDELTTELDPESALASPDWPFIEAKGYYPTRRGRLCEILVIHITAGWGNEIRLGKFFANLKDRHASANMGVGRSGGTAIYAPIDAATWHSGGGVDWDGKGQVNLRSFGIELCNRGSVREKTARDPKWQKRAPFGWTQAVHNKARTLRYWENFGLPQLKALNAVLPVLRDYFPHMRYVTGHEDLVRGKMDPGPMFPWGAFDWESYGLVRMERDWKADAWFEWRGGKRKPYKRAPELFDLRTWRERQQALHDLGYSDIVGKVDGIFGGKTKAGIMAFERDHGLPVDGRWDRDLERAVELRLTEVP